MRKIIFIEPKAPRQHIFSKFISPRLGILILGTMMKKRGWQVEVIIEELTPIDHKRFHDVEIVGISTITSTAPLAYYHADIFKKMNITVIMGGPHVTFLPEEGLEHSDFIIRGA